MCLILLINPENGEKSPLQLSVGQFHSCLLGEPSEVSIDAVTFWHWPWPAAPQPSTSHTQRTQGDSGTNIRRASDKQSRERRQRASAGTGPYRTTATSCSYVSSTTTQRVSCDGATATAYTWYVLLVTLIDVRTDGTTIIPRCKSHHLLFRVLWIARTEISFIINYEYYWTIDSL